jgi:hypothetical protein
MNVPTRRVHRPCAAILLLVGLANAGCVAWHTEDLSPASLIATAHPQQVRVTHRDGSQTFLDHPVLRGDTLTGTVMGESIPRQAAIPLTDVRQLATPRPSAGRTIEFSLGLIAGTAATMVVLLVMTCVTGGGCGS